jgi:AcrR family transcriptional regulator
MDLKNSAFEEIPTHVKDQGLVERRRTQIADAAVEMFLERGFHKTTTRQIARAAGISNGLLYEYVSSKEDILYLVCTLIHTEMQNAVSDALKRADAGLHPLAAAIRDYLRVCHRMGDHILLIYQETQSLPAKWRRVVLDNEIRITELFADVLRQLVKTGELSAMDRDTLDLIAHNISVLGHMWAFRRWFLAGRYTIDDYIRIQTEFILARCREAGSAQPTGSPGKTHDTIPNCG